MSTIDPREFRDSQRLLWGSVALGWRKWWPIIEAGADDLNQRLVELARVRAGDRVLDVATGIGEPALTAARRVGAEGRVLATDLAPLMLEMARERAAQAGLRNVEFREADVHTLDVGPASFDAALCRWGLMLFLDPSAAAIRIRSALRPGARFAAAVWGEAADVPFLALPMQVARRELDLAPPPADQPGPMRLGRRGALEDVLTGAGFVDVTGEERDVAMSFASAGEYVNYLQDMSSSMKKELEARPPADRDRVWRAVERDVKRHSDADGRVRFVNKVRIAVGVRA